MSLPTRRILIGEETLQKRVHSLAQEINRYYPNQDELVVISVLKGSFVFMADLIRKLDRDVEIGFLFFSSYQGGMVSQGKVEVFDLPLPDLSNRHVLLVEDILDTGISLKHAYDLCAMQQPASIKTCILLEKQAVLNQVDVPRDFIGFSLADEFVVGYGLDYNEKYRNLPYIALLDFHSSG